MANPRDILVVTTSSVDGLRIKEYLKPVSAHIVAGTNLFSDFLGGITDVFGGRSQSYQKQLTSLYNEAIDRIKYAAFEIGANCIVGLNIDLDEISGKGKSMFMLTAVGTAVIIEKERPKNEKHSHSIERFENVAVDRVNNLRTKKEIIENANNGSLTLDEDTWNFITANQVNEVFPFLLKKLGETIANDQYQPGSSDRFFKAFRIYIDELPEEIKIQLLYNVVSQNVPESIFSKMSELINEMLLFDYDQVSRMLHADDFIIRKRGVRISTYDKTFYNRDDTNNLFKIKDIIDKTFQERGKRSMKKQILSSKEKEVWTCECGKTNDIDTYCGNCGQDIYGFTKNEIHPKDASEYIEQKIALIKENLE